MSARLKILVVGQTPPPYHGQAMMIERLLAGQYQRVQLYHVRMAFSDEISAVGRFRFGKLLHLVSVIGRIIYFRLVHQVKVLYYPPAGPNRVPLYRDLAILLSTRWMFSRTIFHFHASGVSQLYGRLSRVTQFFVRRALFNPDAAVRITKTASADADFLQARRQYVVPNGIEDEAVRYRIAAEQTDTKRVIYSISKQKTSEATGLKSSGDPSSVAICEAEPLRIFFMGILRESKGLSELLEACGQLQQRGVPFELKVAGEFHSPEYEAQVKQQIEQLGIGSHVHFLGVVQSDGKWSVYGQSDLFCFPTFYESETFPTVLLEAMSFGLPVVATRWRGIAEIVDDGETGFLVDVHDVVAIADRLERLHDDPTLRQRLGRAGREKFLHEFTADRFCARMEEAFVETASHTANAAQTTPLKCTLTP